MNFTDPFSDSNGDKLREECGVFGVIGAPDGAAVTALGLHALQHRGQEAAGITSFDGAEFYTRRGIGHVAANFSTGEAIAELPGHMACGHVRYSTTGGSGLRNVQPLYADLASGGFAVAHNGNISNAMSLREELVGKGAIFQSTSDTEVIIHLVATSRYPTMFDKIVDALRLLEGAYALVVMTPTGMIADGTRRCPPSVCCLTAGPLSAGNAPSGMICRMGITLSTYRRRSCGTSALVATGLPPLFGSQSLLGSTARAPSRTPSSETR